MHSPSDDTEATVVVRRRRGGAEHGEPTPGHWSAGDDDMELTVLAGPGLPPTVVAVPQQGIGSSRPSSSPGSGEPTCPPGLHLLGMVGEGGMGEVLLARDCALRRRVAYKRLRLELIGQRDVALRLLAEAEITAQLDHPNVVPLYSLEQHEGWPVGYVMKLVEGNTLRILIERARSSVEADRPLEPALRRETLLEHFLKVCDAMSFAHAKGVIHRDLKPANIMIGRFNEVYVLDWGIARILDLPDVLPGGGEEQVRIERNIAGQGTDATVQGTPIGTLRYMSPEQARGEIDRMDPRSDLYSLGLILYELVCLRRAFGGAGPDPLLERVQRGERDPILAPSRRFAVPPELRAVIEKATRPAPEDRYPDVGALAGDLRSFLRGESVSVLRETLLRRMLRWVGHHRQAFLSLFLATLLLAALATGALWYRHTEAMHQVRDRRELTRHYLSFASARAQGVVQHFTRILGHLEGLSVGAALALEYGRAADVGLYTDDDFDDPSARPDDLAPNPNYPGLPISTEQPVVVYPPSGADPRMTRDVRRLVALTRLFQGIFLEVSGERLDIGVSGARVREVLSRKDIAVSWLGTALPTGAMVGYPGSGGFPSDYDASLRPWYRQALPEKGSRVCGEPYEDAVYHDIKMACSVSLYSRSGEFLGVCALELPLAGSVAKLLESRDLPQAGALLLNQRGQVLAEVRDDGGKIGRPLREYRDRTVVEAARSGSSGLHERVDAGQALWVVYVYLPELGWTYVTELYAWGVEGPRAGPKRRRPVPPPLPFQPGNGS